MELHDPSKQLTSVVNLIDLRHLTEVSNTIDICSQQYGHAKKYSIPPRIGDCVALVCSDAPDGATRALGMVMHESQQIAAEHHDLAAHAHRTGAEHHGKEDHQTGHESRSEERRVGKEGR